MKTAIQIDTQAASSDGWPVGTISISAPRRRDHRGYFCDLPDEDLRRFKVMKLARSVPRGATLFMQGQETTGVHVLCDGKVKLTACSADGKTIIVQIAEPGEVLGLSAAIEGAEHETSAVALADCRVNYFQTTDLLRLLSGSAAASLNAARLLSRNYQVAHRQICSLGLSDSVFDKIARLLLSWAPTQNGAKCVQIDNFFTHEEIAGMIGSSRETVTRTLKTFRERGLITVNGRELLIHDAARLRAAAGIGSGEMVSGALPLVEPM